MEVDKWTNFPRRTPEFISKAFFGNIEYYLAYEFEEETHMLAYIHWTNEVEVDNIGLLSFSGYGPHEFIDVCAIDHCVGFIKINQVYYIIDKEELNNEFENNEI